MTQFSSVFDLFDKFDQIFASDVCKPNTSQSNLTGWTFPPMDAYKLPSKELVFELAVAGYTEDMITISFDVAAIKVSLAERKLPVDFSNYIIHAVKSAAAERKIPIPPDAYDITATTASIKDGILKLVVPPKKVEPPKTIKINRTL